MSPDGKVFVRGRSAIGVLLFAVCAWSTAACEPDGSAVSQSSHAIEADDGGGGDADPPPDPPECPRTLLRTGKPGWIWQPVDLTCVPACGLPGSGPVHLEANFECENPNACATAHFGCDSNNQPAILYEGCEEVGTLCDR